ncbi:MAG: hypothetical protein CMG46_01735 [Candidatus Marinimicrobia bacterium]|nr:hypothetical protein [Candidatus Neomarinimicrobiota bacterium]|tara:strand:- start:626 stop:8344 length:7719 start_codon:yes stop_codon:yes gene_type:complete
MPKVWNTKKSAESLELKRKSLEIDKMKNMDQLDVIERRNQVQPTSTSFSKVIIIIVVLICISITVWYFWDNISGFFKELLESTEDSSDSNTDTSRQRESPGRRTPGTTPGTSGTTRPRQSIAQSEQARSTESSPNIPTLPNMQAHTICNINDSNVILQLPNDDIGIHTYNYTRNVNDEQLCNAINDVNDITNIDLAALWNKIYESAARITSSLITYKSTYGDKWLDGDNFDEYIQTLEIEKERLNNIRNDINTYIALCDRYINHYESSLNMCIYYKDDCWEKGNKPDSIKSYMNILNNENQYCNSGELIDELYNIGNYKVPELSMYGDVNFSKQPPYELNLESITQNVLENTKICGIFDDKVLGGGGIRALFASWGLSGDAGVERLKSKLDTFKNCWLQHKHLIFNIKVYNQFSEAANIEFINVNPGKGYTIESFRNGDFSIPANLGTPINAQFEIETQPQQASFNFTDVENEPFKGLLIDAYKCLIFQLPAYKRYITAKKSEVYVYDLHDNDIITRLKDYYINADKDDLRTINEYNSQFKPNFDISDIKDSNSIDFSNGDNNPIPLKYTSKSNRNSKILLIYQRILHEVRSFEKGEEVVEGFTIGSSNKPTAKYLENLLQEYKGNYTINSDRQVLRMDDFKKLEDLAKQYIDHEKNNNQCEVQLIDDKYMKHYGNEDYDLHGTISKFKDRSDWMNGRENDPARPGVEGKWGKRVSKSSGVSQVLNQNHADASDGRAINIDVPDNELMNMWGDQWNTQDGAALRFRGRCKNIDILDAGTEALIADHPIYRWVSNKADCNTQFTIKHNEDNFNDWTETIEKMEDTLNPPQKTSNNYSMRVNKYNMLNNGGGAAGGVEVAQHLHNQTANNWSDYDRPKPGVDLWSEPASWGNMDVHSTCSIVPSTKEWTYNTFTEDLQDDPAYISIVDEKDDGNYNSSYIEQRNYIVTTISKLNEFITGTRFNSSNFHQNYKLLAESIYENLINNYAQLLIDECTLPNRLEHDDAGESHESEPAGMLQESETAREFMLEVKGAPSSLVVTNHNLKLQASTLEQLVEQARDDLKGKDGVTDFEDAEVLMYDEDFEDWILLKKLEDLPDNGKVQFWPRNIPRPSPTPEEEFKEAQEAAATRRYNFLSYKNSITNIRVELLNKSCERILQNGEWNLLNYLGYKDARWNMEYWSMKGIWETAFKKHLTNLHKALQEIPEGLINQKKQVDKALNKNGRLQGDHPLKSRFYNDIYANNELSGELLSNTGFTDTVNLEGKQTAIFLPSNLVDEDQPQGSGFYVSDPFQKLWNILIETIDPNNNHYINMSTYELINKTFKIIPKSETEVNELKKVNDNIKNFYNRWFHGNSSSCTSKDYDINSKLKSKLLELYDGGKNISPEVSNREIQKIIHTRIKEKIPHVGETYNYIIKFALDSSLGFFEDVVFRRLDFKITGNLIDEETKKPKTIIYKAYGSGQDILRGDTEVFVDNYKLERGVTYHIKITSEKYIGIPQVLGVKWQTLERKGVKKQLKPGLSDEVYVDDDDDDNDQRGGGQGLIGEGPLGWGVAPTLGAIFTGEKEMSCSKIVFNFINVSYYGIEDIENNNTTVNFMKIYDEQWNTVTDGCSLGSRVSKIEEKWGNAIVPVKYITAFEEEPLRYDNDRDDHYYTYTVHHNNVNGITGNIEDPKLKNLMQLEVYNKDKKGWRIWDNDGFYIFLPSKNAILSNKKNDILTEDKLYNQYCNPCDECYITITIFLSDESQSSFMNMESDCGKGGKDNVSGTHNNIIIKLKGKPVNGGERKEFGPFILSGQSDWSDDGKSYIKKFKVNESISVESVSGLTLSGLNTRKCSELKYERIDINDGNKTMTHMGPGKLELEDDRTEGAITSEVSLKRVGEENRQYLWNDENEFGTSKSWGKIERKHDGKLWIELRDTYSGNVYTRLPIDNNLLNSLIGEYKTAQDISEHIEGLSNDRINRILVDMGLGHLINKTTHLISIKTSNMYTTFRVDCIWDNNKEDISGLFSIHTMQNRIDINIAEKDVGEDDKYAGGSLIIDNLFNNDNRSNHTMNLKYTIDHSFFERLKGENAGKLYLSYKSYNKSLNMNIKNSSDCEASIQNQKNLQPHINWENSNAEYISTHLQIEQVKSVKEVLDSLQRQIDSSLLNYIKPIEQINDNIGKINKRKWIDGACKVGAFGLGMVASGPHISTGLGELCDIVKSSIGTLDPNTGKIQGGAGVYETADRLLSGLESKIEESTLSSAMQDTFIIENFITEQNITTEEMINETNSLSFDYLNDNDDIPISTVSKVLRDRWQCALNKIPALCGIPVGTLVIAKFHEYDGKTFSYNNMWKLGRILKINGYGPNHNVLSYQVEPIDTENNRIRTQNINALSNEFDRVYDNNGDRSKAMNPNTLQHWGKNILNGLEEGRSVINIHLAPICTTNSNTVGDVNDLTNPCVGNDIDRRPINSLQTSNMDELKGWYSKQHQLNGCNDNNDEIKCKNDYVLLRSWAEQTGENYNICTSQSENCNKYVEFPTVSLPNGESDIDLRNTQNYDERVTSIREQLPGLKYIIENEEGPASSQLFEISGLFNRGENG